MVAYSFKKQFIEPIRVGLSSVSLSFDCAPKRQTIRAIGKRRHARPGEILQLYYGMRTKQCMSIGVARCTLVTPIVISTQGAYINLGEGNIRNRRSLNTFARRDGFATWSEMRTFWLENHGTEEFSGLLIEWEQIRG